MEKNICKFTVDHFDLFSTVEVTLTGGTFLIYCSLKNRYFMRLNDKIFGSKFHEVYPRSSLWQKVCGS